MPRALHRHGRLAHLVTDAWVAPRSTLRLLPGGRARRLRERFHGELAQAPVTHFTASLIARELLWSLRRSQGWQLFSARNRWFARRAAGVIQKWPSTEAAMVVAHSYAALEIFQAAKRRGFRCVLAQIDPGERHFEVVGRASAEAPEYGPPPPAPPADYFERWRQECALADRIVVNSEWSRRCLDEAGVPAAKMSVVPLAYDGEPDASAVRVHPARFTRERPLRVLYVGQVSVAKGVKALLDALALVGDAALELTMVGETAAHIPARHREDRRIRWIGPVSRSEVMNYYRAADVLAFPSLSDGFGMAQVEAAGWRLPIVASHSCGRVVSDGVNGLLLPEVTPQTIAGALNRLLAEPGLLAAFSAASPRRPGDGLAALGDSLLALEAAL